MWSEEKLVVHIGGIFDDANTSVSTYLYPQTFSESQNTILTQLHTFLCELSQVRSVPPIVYLTLDNHATQKGYTFLAYFEWLFAAGVRFFMCWIFLLYAVFFVT